jgi:glycosyltransferase involved in cell wall biosynthesis
MIDIENINVGIIIPVFNRLNTTETCLARLDHILNNFTIYVVDDNSTDGTSEMLKKFPRVRVIQGSGDLWWSGAVNLGMKQCLEDICDVFIWLNDDCLISNENLISLVTISVQNPNAIFTPSYICSLYPSFKKHAGPVKSTAENENLVGNFVIPLVHCAGQCVVFPISILKTLGTIDTQSFPHYGDAIYTLMSEKSGFPVYEVPSIQAEVNFCCFRRIPPEQQILLAKNPSKFSLRDLLSSKRSTYNLVHRLNWYLLIRGKMGYVYFLISLIKVLICVNIALVARRFMSAQFCILVSRICYIHKTLDWQMLKLDIEKDRTDFFL